MSRCLPLPGLFVVDNVLPVGGTTGLAAAVFVAIVDAGVDGVVVPFDLVAGCGVGGAVPVLGVRRDESGEKQFSAYVQGRSTNAEVLFHLFAFQKIRYRTGKLKHRYSARDTSMVSTYRVSYADSIFFDQNIEDLQHEQPTPISFGTCAVILNARYVLHDGLLGI